MSEFTRRGILGALIVAPVANMIQVVRPPAVEPPKEIESVEFDEGFEICLLNRDGEEITERLPISTIDDPPTVTFPQHEGNEEAAVAYRLYLPLGLSECFGMTHVDHNFEAYCRDARLKDGDVELVFDHGGLFAFARERADDS